MTDCLFNYQDAQLPLAGAEAWSGYHPYRDSAYAEALTDAGAPLEVAPWGTWVTTRRIGDSNLLDAAGLYPLHSIAAGSDIAAGRRVLEAAGLVSFVGVADPFASPPPAALAREFDVCRPFKEHSIIDRRLGKVDFSRHHRNEIKRAFRLCVVDQLALGDHLDCWIQLYDELIERRHITGAQHFSKRYFERLAAMPNVGCFIARRDGVIVAMSLWLRGNRIAYNHLGASSAAGYSASASYALYAAAIEQYGDCDILNLGGGAGLQDEEDGLVRFKRGFANGVATAHLCGMVLDREAYQSLSANKTTDYFPMYRR